MGTTSLDHHLRDGKSESLARAKATLKDRLRQKMMQEALDELQDTKRVVDEAMDAFAAQEDALAEAKEAFKARLLDQVRQQALEEIAADIDASSLEDAEAEVLAEAKEAFKQRLLDQTRKEAIEEAGAAIAEEAIEGHAENDDLAKASEAFKARLLDHFIQQAVGQVTAEAEKASDDHIARADGDALNEAKAAFKARLLDHVLQQAIEEIDAEVDLDVEAVTGAAEEGAALTLALSENVEELYDGLGEPTIEPEQPEVDAHFWEFENAHIDDLDNLTTEETLPEDEEQGGDDSGFFLSDPIEPGSDSEAASSGELAEGGLDFAGDGAWQNADPVGDVEAPEDTVAASEVYYVYGVLSGADIDKVNLPKGGVDPLFPVYALDHEHVHALVSKASVKDYGKDALPVNLLDPKWKEKQAKAHDGFVERFSKEGIFLPVPFCTVYESEDAVREMLSEISYLDALDKIQGRSQWHLKLYRNVEVLHQQVVENSTAVQQLMTDIKSQPKAGAHSIKKQMVSTIREEEAAMTDNCTKDVHERLYVHAEDVELGTLTGEGERENVELILEATYLVPKDQEETFVEDVEELIGEYTTYGFEFNVSGPAPPTLFSRLQPAESR